MERYAILVENTNYNVHYCIKYNNNPIMILITDLDSLQYFKSCVFLFIAFFLSKYLSLKSNENKLLSRSKLDIFWDLIWKL